MDKSKSAALLSLTEEELNDAVKGLKPVPETDRDKHLVSLLTYTALETALHRHAGKFRESFTTKGKRTMAEGRDLTAVSCMIGTGGRSYKTGERNGTAAQGIPGGKKE